MSKKLEFQLVSCLIIVMAYFGMVLGHDAIVLSIPITVVALVNCCLLPTSSKTIKVENGQPPPSTIAKSSYQAYDDPEEDPACYANYGYYLNHAKNPSWKRWFEYETYLKEKENDARTQIVKIVISNDR